ncbi:MAG TPA: hypothetical protein VI670_23900 [Thermoanaerobaculia bacterium]|jgi:tetratricopeptide (TPR) repeat protein
MPATRPESIVIQTGDGADAISLVAPSLWGSIYRSRRRAEYYRVVPLEEASTAVVSSAAQWIGKPPKRGLATIVEVRHSLEVDLSFVFIRYARAEGRTLAELLREGTVGEQLQLLARVAEALPQWWGGTAAAALPTPADIVLPEDSDAVLLPAPFHHPVDAAAVFAHPARARYLSPERLRSMSVPSEDADDLYALGVMLLGVFYRLPELSAEEALLRAANRTLYAAEALESALPSWRTKIEAVQAARAQAFSLIASSAAERLRVDPRDLASRLANWARSSEPFDAVESLRGRGLREEALALLSDILSHQPSHELLLEAALLAAEQHRVLEALEYVERAISLEPDQTGAHALQLTLFSRLMDTPPASGEERMKHLDLIERLEAMLWRDFGALPKDVQSRFESVVSRFLLARSRYREATNFIFPRLRDNAGTHLWWKFDLSLDYAEALMGISAMPQARESLLASKLGLQKVRASRTISDFDIHRIGTRIADLERRLGPAGGAT